MAANLTLIMFSSRRSSFVMPWEGMERSDIACAAARGANAAAFGNVRSPGGSVFGGDCDARSTFLQPEHPNAGRRREMLSRDYAKHCPHLFGWGAHLFCPKGKHIVAQGNALGKLPHAGCALKEALQSVSKHKPATDIVLVTPVLPRNAPEGNGAEQHSLCSSPKGERGGVRQPPLSRRVVFASGLKARPHKAQGFSLCARHIGCGLKVPRANFDRNHRLCPS